jgi:hypothetical protein
MKEEEESSSALALLASLGIGAGAYALTRKFRPSSLPKLRELQEAAEAGGASGYVPKIGFGPVKEKIFEGALSGIFGMPMNKKTAVKFNVLQDPDTAIKAKQVINPHNIVDELSGKASFAKTAQEFMPKSRTLKEALREAGSPEKLKKAMGGDYLIKPEYGSLEKITDFATHADVLGKSAKAKAAIKSPDKFMIQQKLPSSMEYRVHMLDGQPYGISERFLPDKLNEITKGRGGGLIPVFNRTKRQQLSEFVQNMSARTKWGNLPEGQHSHMAFDILETPQGFKIVDANPSPATMINPINSRQLNRLMTGRWGKDVSGLAGLGAGGLTYGALGGHDDGR